MKKITGTDLYKRKVTRSYVVRSATCLTGRYTILKVQIKLWLLGHRHGYIEIETKKLEEITLPENW